MAYEKTSVAVERSQGELRKLLRAHGAEAFQFSEGTKFGKTWAAIEFAHGGRRVRMLAPYNEPDMQSLQKKARNARTKTFEDLLEADREQEAKRIWRVIFHSLKARMVAVEEGLETLEEAFLSHLVNPATNKTIYEELSETGRVELPEPMPSVAIESGERG